MFKSIQYKIVAVFILLVLSIAISMGVLMTTNTVSFYHREFSSMMENTFTE